MKRRPGVVGLYFFIAIRIKLRSATFVEIELLRIGGQRDPGLLQRVALAWQQLTITDVFVLVAFGAGPFRVAGRPLLAAVTGGMGALFGFVAPFVGTVLTSLASLVAETKRYGNGWLTNC